MAPLTFITPVATSFKTSFTGMSLRIAQPRNNILFTARRTTPSMVSAPERPSQTSTVAPISDKMSVLLPEKLSDTGIQLLSKKFNVVKKLDLTPQQLLEEIQYHDAVIIRSGTKMTREVIEAGSKLKVIGRAGVGVDNIDIPAASERGVLVVNAPTGNCVAAAEHTIALLCSMSRHISAADATMKSGAWNRSSFVGASLVDKTMGVVGLGRIGREVAKRARGLGMQVVAYDPFASEESAAAIGVTLLPFDGVLSAADFLTLHIPLIPDTKNLIDEVAISKMRKGARLINAARGGIVNENALLKALESGHIAAAALDCFENEPPNKYPDSVSSKLVNHPNVLATPHLGASTREAQLDVAVEIATAVRDTLDGDMVSTMINAPAMPPHLLKSLKPKALLCQSLGKLAYYISGGMLHGEVSVDYFIPDASEDTRFLRSGLIRGLMQASIGMKISIVNADTVAKNAGLGITEVNHITSHDNEECEIRVTVKGSPPIEGRVINGNPHVTRIGRFEVDLRLDGIIMVYSQNDRPGQLGLVGSLFGETGVNISSMTLARDSNSSKALVLLGVDSRPDIELVSRVNDVINDSELHPIVIEF